MSWTFRALTNDDALLLDTFLTPHTAEAYFLRSNAQRVGLTYEGKFLHGEYFGAFKDDKLAGVGSYTWLNGLLIFAQTNEAIPFLAQAVTPSLLARGGKIDVMIGLEDQVKAFEKALKIPAGAFRQQDKDWLFRLDISAINHPILSPDLYVRPARESDEETLTSWRCAFNIEAVAAAPGAELEAAARREIKERIAGGDIYMLEQAGQPCACCVVGGFIEDTVMIGFVWTPPALRGKGYARAVTGWALRLCAEKREGRLKNAVLFASRPDAIRVYEKLGFRKIADWGLDFLKETYRFTKTDA